MRLFSDREKQAPKKEDVAEVILSSLTLKHPRSFGACWAGCKLWEEELQLGEFWSSALGQERGGVPWEKVIELLAVNRLVAPRSELSVHEKWFFGAILIIPRCIEHVAPSATVQPFDDSQSVIVFPSG